MGTVRGRAVLDLFRHRFGWTARGAFDTKAFWDQSYAKTYAPHEWALPPAALLRHGCELCGDASRRRRGVERIRNV